MCLLLSKLSSLPFSFLLNSFSLNKSRNNRSAITAKYTPTQFPPYKGRKERSENGNSKRPRNFISQFTTCALYSRFCGVIGYLVRLELRTGRATRCETQQVSQSKHLIRKTKWEGRKNKKRPPRNPAVIPKDFLRIKLLEFSVKVSISKVPARPTGWQKLCNSRGEGISPRKSPDDNYKLE